MNARRIFAGSAIALTTFFGVAAPAAAVDYPITRPTQEVEPQGATGPTEVKGTKTGQGQGGNVSVGNVSQDTSDSGLASTGADLAPLWGGMALVLAGGGLVLVTRRRRGTPG